jgi:hypothetical protein
VVESKTKTKHSISEKIDSQSRNDNDETSTQSKNNQTEPSPSNFNIPKNEEELAVITRRVQECGMSLQESLSEIERRKKKYNLAHRRFTAKKDKQTKSHKNSIIDHAM